MAIVETRKPLYEVECDLCEYAESGNAVPMGWGRIKIECHLSIGQVYCELIACPTCVVTGAKLPRLELLRKRCGV
jgi:hypothetical protein